MKKKTIALLLVMVMLFGITVGGTIAYLTDSKQVTNTFTVGKVQISLDETKVDAYGVAVNADDLTKAAFDAKVSADEIAADSEWVAATTNGNEYKLIPGHEYTKDPTIHVDDKSEDCYLFVKVENGLGNNATLTWTEGWTQVAGTTDCWQYKAAVSKGADVKTFTEFTVSGTANVDELGNQKIVVTAYAVQADGMIDAADAWTKTFGAPATTEG